MGTTLARKINGMSLWSKIGIVFILLTGIFVYQGVFQPGFLNSATNTYYFTTDSTSVNLSADGSTQTTASLGGRISMKTGVYATSRSVSAASTTTEQRMTSAYGPLYASTQVVSAPALTIGVRDRNGTANNITWRAYVYDYNPAVAPGAGNPTAKGAANNATLLWTSDDLEAHPAVQTPIEFKFTNPAPKKILASHRLKVVITCQMANTASSARLYWGNTTNYSFFTVTEAAYIANSLTVTNLSDYYSGGLTNVTQGDGNVPMLKFDMYYSESAGSATWSGGKLDRIGNNTSIYLNPDEPGDLTFSIWKDADNDGVFEATDTLIGGPYTFNQLTAQTYTLTAAQTISNTPQRYFITYNVSRTATPSTTVGAKIPAEDPSTYFTSNAAGGVRNVTLTNSSTPNIDYGGVAISKVYKADWDSGTSLVGFSESGATQLTPNQTDSACVTRNTTGAGFPLVGLLNYPAHACTSVAGQGYINSSGTTQADFTRLYFGGVGYPSAMKSVKGTSFTYRVSTTFGGGTVTLQLFYVTSGGVRVNAPISSKYTTTSTINQAITTSLAGQDFTNVPQGARLGIQIGVTNNVRIGLGSSNGMTGSSSGANLTVSETAAENENVDVGNGTTIPNANVYAGDVNKVINSFTLNSAKDKTVTGLTLTGNAMFNSTNIKNIRLYQDTGTYGVLEAEPVIATLPGSAISGNSISFTGLSLLIKPTVKRYLVAVDIADTPNVNVILKALVTGVTVATTGGLGNNSDSASATLTIQPTTSLTDGAGEPISQIINAKASATLIDAFGIKTNGGLNDQINTVTVTLSTVSSVPAGSSLSDYVARVEIINRANSAVYGYLTSPTHRDTNVWQIATNGLYATAATTECYVRITPKANLGGTYVVKAAVTDLTHIRTINQLPTRDDDITSATITLDGAAPNDPGNFTATTASNAAGINLNWDPATDDSGSAVTYTVVRGLGNAPTPINCTPVAGKVFLVYQGAHPGTSPDVYNSGLEEGQSYSYRACSTDSVGNVSIGSHATTTAGIINRCNLAPTLEIKPSATYIKAGETKQLVVSVTNNDTGVCGSASTFNLSLTGTPNSTEFDAPIFDANNFVLSTNGGSKYLKLNVTAKAGAPYQALNEFGVKVVKSGASAATVNYPTPLRIVVNKYGTMMHSSLQLGTTKYGQWGTDYDCSTCHHEISTNIKRVSDVIATPTGNRPVVFQTISASESVTTGVFGNDKRAGSTSTNVCEVCHHRARFHQYSASKVAWNTHNNSSDCMRCHDHRIGFKTLAEGLSCTDCHGYPPLKKDQLVIPPTNVLYPYITGDDAGAHGKHNDRKLKCQTCHNNGNHLTTAQPDAKLNMGFSIRSSNFPGFNPNSPIANGSMKSVDPANDYTYATDTGTTVGPAYDKIMTCSVYCHGYWNGSYTTSGGYNTEPAWSGTTQTGCGSCHGATGSQPPPTGSHKKHAGTLQGYGNGIACTVCHGFRNYSTSAVHINGNVEWDLSTITTSATYNGLNKGSTGAISPTAPGSYKSCANLYCHSNVQSAGGTAGPTSYGNPTWGGTTTCGSCHSDPNTSGGHSQHTAPPDVEGFDCRICHGSGGDANSLNHANGKINFMFSGLADNTHYSYSSSKVPGSGPYGNCYNSDCHGRRTITWGPSNPALSLCNKCHSTNVTAGGFYGTAGPSSTTANTDPYVGAHFQHITSMPFKLSAKLDCTQCHIKPDSPYSPGHIDTALPAEIKFGVLANSGAMNGYSSAAHQPSYNYATKQCSNVWCHGAGMNSNEGTGPYGSVGPTLDGGTLGAPDAKAAIWNAPYLATAADKCQTCHASPPPAPESGYMHFDDDTGAAYARNKCTNCHRELNSTATGFVQPELHVNGIIDSCYNCHGRPPIDDETLTKPAIGALNIGMVGAHQAHRLNPAIGNDCSACHYNFTYDMPSYKLEIGFRAYGNRVTKGTFYGMSTLPSVGYAQPIVYFSTWTSTKVRRTNNTTKINTCENVYCHGSGTTTLPALGGGTNNKPNWEAGPSQASCGSCHGVTGETYRTRGSHGAHVGTLFGEPHLACANCHGIKENNYHVDGKVEWEFYSSAKRMNTAAQAAGYAGTFGYKPSGAGSFTVSGFANNLAPSASYGTCQVYCHSDVYDKSFKVPTWGGTAMSCDSCHRNQTSVGRFTGTHQKHAASSANGGYGIECMMCHYGSGAGNSLHINGTVDIIFNPAVVGSNGVYAPGASEGSGTCKNILCHISTSSTGPTWGGGAASGSYDTGTYKPTCIGCHSGQLNGRAAAAADFGGQSHHIQGVAMSNSWCYPCHMEANDSLGNINATYHDRTAGKPVDLVIWGAGSRGAAFTRYTANGSAARKRTELAKINNVCIGCHRTRNDATQPFSTAGDTRTPKAYAWDAASIYNRYSSGSVIDSATTATNTTYWGKVTGNNTAAKGVIDKAYSAHGQAKINERGWTTTADTFSASVATNNVLCFDCHNSHGSNASGVMSSYSSANGRYAGGILKSTTNGTGGYTADYVPNAGGSSAAPDNNAYNAGASLCFDCHNNKTAGATAPWGYNSTFGFTSAIYGYNDKPYFSNYSSFASTVTYPYKKNNPDNKGGHFGPSSNLTTAVTSRTFANGMHDNPYSAGTSSPINGLCTPCHDPHGVSRNTTYVSTRAYGVPLLKGTWVSSPYKQDAAPATTNEARGGGRNTSAINIGSMAGYRIDQGTMGAANSTDYAWVLTTTAATLQTQTDTQFAGLCLGCHAKTELNNTAAVTSTNWKTMKRIHNTVEGWAVTTGTGGNVSNKMHAFTCSKCHTPHNSKLPRLLVTNCLDVKHRGRVASGGSQATVLGQNGSRGAGAGRFPQGGGGSGSSPKTSAGPWFFGKASKATSVATTTQTQCHQSTTAGGASPGGNLNTNSGSAQQLWNTKTPW